MKLLRPLLFSFILALTLAACGTQATGSTSPTTTSAPTATMGTTATTGMTLQTASATVGGKAVTLLTNAQGMTLYYFQPDTATTTACTGGCASTWPPLLSSDASVPTSATSLPSALTVQANANGKQVEYNGHPLYTYTGDTSAGQTNGEGIGNKWFVVTPDLAQNKGASGGGYGKGY